MIHVKTADLIRSTHSKIYRPIYTFDVQVHFVSMTFTSSESFRCCKSSIPPRSNFVSSTQRIWLNILSRSHVAKQFCRGRPFQIKRLIRTLSFVVVVVVDRFYDGNTTYSPSVTSYIHSGNIQVHMRST